MVFLYFIFRSIGKKCCTYKKVMLVVLDIVGKKNNGYNLNAQYIYIYMKKYVH